ncbi:MAG TPA: hypothetical protein VFT95_03480 [Micromonosporaceae bacterium]|nr:hypothetical protein [Micromonosporaceae bacterium]
MTTDQPIHYEIRVEGVLDCGWTAWFEGLHLVSDGDHTTMSGRLTDQPALHGVLAKVRDLGLVLISVRRVAAPGPPSDQGGDEQR